MRTSTETSIIAMSSYSYSSTSTTVGLGLYFDGSVDRPLIRIDCSFLLQDAELHERFDYLSPLCTSKEKDMHLEIPRRTVPLPEPECVSLSPLSPSLPLPQLPTTPGATPRPSNALFLGSSSPHDRAAYTDEAGSSQGRDSRGHESPAGTHGHNAGGSYTQARELPSSPYWATCASPCVSS
ncbi:hypothetical protein PLICRDRAFT_283786 [Plicaturopsis crispa FD-325 SS-3]|nr:hypothetical protein PLICRDRAFT_283786 [Plicaturopsis crispa FD-325 SS-3]